MEDSALAHYLLWYEPGKMAATPRISKLKQTPTDVWSIRERLALACSVMRSGDQNWVSVSRAVKPYGEPNRSTDWFSQKNCALQYSDLLEKVETPKRKRSERGETETPGNQIVRKLTIERIEELKQMVQQQQQQYKKLKREIETMNAGHCDDKLKEMWQEIYQAKHVGESSTSTTPQRPVEEVQTQPKLAGQAPVKRPLLKLITNLTAGETVDKPDTSFQSATTTASVPDDSSQPVVSSVPMTQAHLDSKPKPTPPPSPLLSSLLQNKNKYQELQQQHQQQLVQQQQHQQQQQKQQQTQQHIPQIQIKQEPIDPDPVGAQLSVTPSITVAPPISQQVEVVASSASVAAVAKPETPTTPSPAPLTKTRAGAPTLSRLLAHPPGTPSKLTASLSPLVSTSEPLSKPSAPPATVASSPTVVTPTVSVLPEQVMSSTPTTPIATTPKKEPATPSSDKLVPEPSSGLSGSESIQDTSLNVTADEEPVSPASSGVSNDTDPGSTRSSSKRRSQGGKAKVGRPRGRLTRSRASEEKKDGESGSKPSEAESSDDEQPSDDAFNVATPKLSLTMESIPNSPASLSQCSDTEDEKAYKVWKKSIMLVWRSAANHKYANVFLHPVTEEIAPGYHGIVYRPMDLSTIKKNIENGIIKSTAEFQRDMMLMFTNAIMYNSSDHNVYHMAVEMYNDAMMHIEQYVNTQMMVQSETKILRTSRRSDAGASDKEEDSRKRRISTEQDGGKAKKRKTRADDKD